MKIYLKYIFTFLFALILGFNLFGQTNDNTPNLILSREKIENTPSVTLKENAPKIIVDKNIFVNRQIVEMNSVFQNVPPQLSNKDADHDLSTTKLHLNNEQSLKAKKETYNIIEIKSSKARTINYPKASLKKK